MAAQPEREQTLVPDWKHLGKKTPFYHLQQKTFKDKGLGELEPLLAKLPLKQTDTFCAKSFSNITFFFSLKEGQYLLWMFFNKNSLGTTCLLRGIVRKPAHDMPVGETEEELKIHRFKPG